MSFDPEILKGLSPAELEQRRGQIVSTMAKLPRSYTDAPTEMLQELAYITGALRKRTAGPPKATKPTKTRSTAPAMSLDDLDSML